MNERKDDVSIEDRRVIVMIWNQYPDKKGDHIEELKEFPMDEVPEAIKEYDLTFGLGKYSNVQRLKNSLNDHGYYMQKRMEKRGNKHYFIYLNFTDGVDHLFNRFPKYYKGVDIIQYKRGKRLDILLDK